MGDPASPPFANRQQPFGIFRTQGYALAQLGILDAGEVSSATATTITDQTKNWLHNSAGTAGPFDGCNIQIINGTGAGQVNRLTFPVANTSGQSSSGYNVAFSWQVIPDQTSRYIITSPWADSTSYSIDSAIGSTSIFGINPAQILLAPAATVGGETATSFYDTLMGAGLHTVSATNTAVTIIIHTRNLWNRLSIVNSVSGGAPTFAVSASVDNSNYLTIDTGLAVGVKEYFGTTVGATTAVSPLAFQYIKYVIGSAGVGNTSTTDITMK